MLAKFPFLGTQKWAVQPLHTAAIPAKSSWLSLNVHLQPAKRSVFMSVQMGFHQETVWVSFSPLLSTETCAL